jgi:hypothetical protein
VRQDFHRCPVINAVEKSYRADDRMRNLAPVHEDKVVLARRGGGGGERGPRPQRYLGERA